MDLDPPKRIAKAAIPPAGSKIRVEWWGMGKLEGDLADVGKSLRTA